MTSGACLVAFPQAVACGGGRGSLSALDRRHGTKRQRTMQCMALAAAMLESIRGLIEVADSDMV